MHVGPRSGPSARLRSRGRMPAPACAAAFTHGTDRRRSTSAAAPISDSFDRVNLPATAATVTTRPSSAANATKASSPRGRPLLASAPCPSNPKSQAKNSTGTGTRGLGKGAATTTAATTFPSAASTSAATPVTPPSRKQSPPKLTKVAARVVVKALRNAIFPPKDNPFVEGQEQETMEAHSSEYEVFDRQIREEEEVDTRMINLNSSVAYTAFSRARGLSPSRPATPASRPSVSASAPAAAAAEVRRHRRLNTTMSDKEADENVDEDYRVEDKEIDYDYVDDDYDEQEEEREHDLRRESSLEVDVDTQEEVRESEEEFCENRDSDPGEERVLASEGSGVGLEAAESAEAAAGRCYLLELRAEAGRLGLLATRGEKELRNAERLPEHAQETLRAATGQARLLLNKKLQQFEKLCLRHVAFHDGNAGGAKAAADDGALPTTAEDLAGFWDLVKLQVDHVDGMFCEVERLRRNGWLERPAPRLASANNFGSGGNRSASPRSSAGPTRAAVCERPTAAPERSSPDRRRQTGAVSAPPGPGAGRAGPGSARLPHVTNIHGSAQQATREVRESKDSIRSARWRKERAGSASGRCSGGCVCSSCCSPIAERADPAVSGCGGGSARVRGEKASPRTYRRASPQSSPRSSPATVQRRRIPLADERGAMKHYAEGI